MEIAFIIDGVFVRVMGMEDVKEGLRLSGKLITIKRKPGKLGDSWN